MSDEEPEAEPTQRSILPTPAKPVYRDPAAVALSSSARLEEDNRHPVLVFGASLSGKSTMIMAIINALEKSGSDGKRGVQVSFGQSFYQKRDDRAAAQMQMALNFYEAGSNNFILGREALDSTQEQIPFFIPLDLRVRGSEPETAKIAIMDGRGEWYEPNKTNEGGVLRAFQLEIEDVLKNYSRGISIILVAPYSLGEGDRDDVSNCDMGLWKCLQEYLILRRNSNDDAVLLLLTKWDQASSPNDSDGRFIRLTGSEVAEILDKRYERTWPAFGSLAIGADNWDRKAFMQYASCDFLEGRPRILPQQRWMYLRYPRTVINWIYGNARRIQFAEDDGGYTRDYTEILFHDVIDPETPTVSFPKWFLRQIVR